MFTEPLGICNNFQFHIGNVVYSTLVYVVCKASFQLLLGTEFIWKAGITLFPRWGAIMLSLPEFQVIRGTCERVSADKAPPSLVPPGPTPSQAPDVDPLSGIPFETSPPAPSQLFSYLDTHKPFVPFLRVSVSPFIISIGERDYLKDAELDNLEPLVTSVPKDFLTLTISDSYVRSVIDIYPAAPAWFTDAMVDIILKYHEAISWHEYDLGCVTHSPHDIKLLPGTKGIRQSSRAHLYSLRNGEIIQSKTRPFVEMGIWTPCEFSDWCAQLVIAAKNHICHDFTDLNRLTVRDTYPIVAMAVILRRFAGKGMFSVWDADCGFNQIINTSGAAEKAAFEFLRRLYNSLRMLFGCTNSPATFARNMDPTVQEVRQALKSANLLQDLNNYFDDCILSGPSDEWQNHLRATSTFLEIAIRYGWKFKCSKIRIAYTQVSILGVIVSAFGKRAHPQKVDTLLAICTPRNSSEVKSFVGLAHWFQEHIKGLAWNIVTLNKLSVAGEEFTWSEAAEREFQWVKKQIKDPSVLAIWSPVKTSCLYTDASAISLSCFLTQLAEDNKAEVVIAFGSVALTSAQRKYQITHSEALAFIWSLGHFHAYLCARLFLWKTDHRTLKYIFDASRSQVPVLAKYKLIADEYKLCPVWISGSTMIADVFSRLCVVPAGKVAMTNREMVMADLDLSKIADTNGRLQLNNFTANFLFSENVEANTETDADDDDLDPDLNPHDQPLHKDEDSIRGKLAIDVPAFSVDDLFSI
jgi:RNase H-like domain found in reverse transcriptase/Reverse transcriptase (RNA-dependent DNA polymerase)